MPTIAFIPGWSEGSWHSKLIEQKLAVKGIHINQDLNKADILFCHSTGCYLVPEDAQAKLIVLVGLPYWPNRSLVYSGIKKFTEDLLSARRNVGFLWWCNKTLHNMWYMLKYPKDTVFVATKHKPENLPKPKKHKVLMIRNQQDYFCHPKINKILDKTKGYSFAELPGGHDDCWSGKQAYIDLIMKAFASTN
jgi:hypothetical protein